MEWTAATGSGLCGEGCGLYSEIERQEEMQEERLRDGNRKERPAQISHLSAGAGWVDAGTDLATPGSYHPRLRSHSQSGPCRVGAWQGAVNTGTGQLGTRCCYLPLPESASPWQRGSYQILLQAHPPSLQPLSRHCRGRGTVIFTQAADSTQGPRCPFPAASQPFCLLSKQLPAEFPGSAWKGAGTV